MTGALILTLLLTDMVDSTQLVSALGDRRASEVNARCDEALRALLRERGGREIDKSDGFLFTFERPIDAVRFALAMHGQLERLSAELGVSLRQRAGIHLGEVIVREASEDARAIGAKAVELEGIAKPLAARVMSLAVGGQTLLTRAAFDLARRAAKGDDAVPTEARWLAHGEYSLKGIEDPVEICEVGIEGTAPLAPPPDSEKARSIVPIDAAMVQGWRPSPGAEVPSAPGWFAAERLGEGGFGEVWRCVRQRTSAGGDISEELEALPVGTSLAFKFCFDIVHARALRREATLFKIIRQRFGRAKGIVHLHGVQLDRAPLFLAMEYVEGSNLAEWLHEEGPSRKPHERLRMMAPVAEAIGALHEAGIVLNDIKPSNILIRYGRNGTRELLLTDLGIGRLRDKGVAGDLTSTTGFTRTMPSMELGSESNSGTLLFIAPEILEGNQPSPASDAYAFGVTLMQVAACDPHLAVSDRWRRRVRGGPVRRLIGRLLRGDPDRRLADFARIAKSLRTIRRQLVVSRLRLGLVGSMLGTYALWLLWAWGYVGPTARREALQAVAEAYEKKNIALDADHFRKKYALTRSGEIAVDEAAALFRSLDFEVALDDYITSGAPPFPATAAELRLHRMAEVLGKTPDSAAIVPRIDQWEGIAQRIEEWSRRWEPQALESPFFCWYFDPFKDELIPPRMRRFGDSAAHTKVSKFLLLREYVRLSGTAVFHRRLDEGRTAEGWSWIVSTSQFSRALRASGSTLVDAMIGVAVEGILLDAMIVEMNDAPPDAETALRLARAMDAHRMAFECERGFELEVAGFAPAIEYLSGHSSAMPNSLGGGSPSKADVLAGELSSKGPKVLRQLSMFHYTPFANLDHLEFVRFHAKAIELFRTEGARAEILEQWNRRTSQIPPERLILQIALPSYGRAFAVVKRRMNDAELARAMCLRASPPSSRRTIRRPCRTRSSHCIGATDSHRRAIG